MIGGEWGSGSRDRMDCRADHGLRWSRGAARERCCMRTGVAHLALRLFVLW